MLKPYIPQEGRHLYRNTLRYLLRQLSKRRQHFVNTATRELSNLTGRILLERLKKKGT